MALYAGSNEQSSNPSCPCNELFEVLCSLYLFVELCVTTLVSLSLSFFFFEGNVGIDTHTLLVPYHKLTFISSVSLSSTSFYLSNLHICSIKLDVVLKYRLSLCFSLRWGTFSFSIYLFLPSYSIYMVYLSLPSLLLCTIPSLHLSIRISQLPF